MAETWLPIEQLTEQLHCGQRTIYQLRDQGLIVAGKHFYAAAATGKGRNIYCLEAVRSVLMVQTAQYQEARKQKVLAQTTYDTTALEALVSGVIHKREA